MQSHGGPLTLNGTSSYESPSRSHSRSRSVSLSLEDDNSGTDIDDHNGSSDATQPNSITHSPQPPQSPAAAAAAAVAAASTQRSPVDDLDSDGIMNGDEILQHEDSTTSGIAEFGRHGSRMQSRSVLDKDLNKVTDATMRNVQRSRATSLAAAAATAASLPMSDSNIDHQYDHSLQVPPVSVDRSYQYQNYEKSAKSMDASTLYGTYEGDELPLHVQLTVVPSVKRIKPCYIVLPDNMYRQMWDMIVVILLLYTVVVLPWRLAFAGDGFSPLDLIVDSLFFIDICFQFLTAYEDKDGHVIVSWKRISKRYCKSWFVIDLFSTFPFYLVINSSASRASTLLRVPRLFKLVRLLRLLKLLRAYRLGAIFKLLEDNSNIHPGVFRLLKLFLSILTMIHFSGCIWVFIGKLQEDATDCLGGQCSWIDEAALTGITSQTATDWSLYCVGAYWAVVTFTSTGYGDIVPVTDLERVYAMALMLVGVVTVGYTTAVIASLIASWDLRASHVRIRMESLTAFMQLSRFPADLKARLRRHFRFAWEESRNAYDAGQLLSEMPAHLRRETAMWLHRDLMSVCSFLNHLAEDNFVAEVVMALRPSKYQAGDIIGQFGHTVTDWHLVRHGAVAAQPRLDVDEAFMKFYSGSTFGEVGILITGVWGANFVCVEDTTLMSVSRRDLQRLLAEYPHTRDQLFGIAERRYLTLLRGIYRRHRKTTLWRAFLRTPASKHLRMRAHRKHQPGLVRSKNHVGIGDFKNDNGMDDEKQSLDSLIGDDIDDFDIDHNFRNDGDGDDDDDNQSNDKDHDDEDDDSILMQPSPQRLYSAVSIELVETMSDRSGANKAAANTDRGSNQLPLPVQTNGHKPSAHPRLTDSEPIMSTPSMNMTSNQDHACVNDDGDDGDDGGDSGDDDDGDRDVFNMKTESHSTFSHLDSMGHLLNVRRPPSLMKVRDTLSMTDSDMHAQIKKLECRLCAFYRFVLGLSDKPLRRSSLFGELAVQGQELENEASLRRFFEFLDHRVQFAHSAGDDDISVSTSISRASSIEPRELAGFEPSSAPCTDTGLRRRSWRTGQLPLGRAQTMQRSRSHIPAMASHTLLQPSADRGQDDVPPIPMAPYKQDPGEIQQLQRQLDRVLLLNEEMFKMLHQQKMML
jgi:Ion transport protein/Cyclic nucleotide-binding domain